MTEILTGADCISAHYGDVAIVLAAHGDRAGPAPNATIEAHRAALDTLQLYASVQAGFLKGEPDIESALRTSRQSGARRILVYPIFMSDGYFTRQVLAPRIAALAIGVPCQMLAPLGLDPRLPDLMLNEALAAAATHGIAVAATRLLVVGHGSQISPASANATRKAAHAIAATGPFTSVTTAFLEEPPFLTDALAAHPEPTIVSGFFSGDGLHAGEDIPAAITQSGARAIYAGSIGKAPGVRDLIRGAIEQALSL